MFIKISAEYDMERGAYYKIHDSDFEHIILPRDLPSDTIREAVLLCYASRKLDVVSNFKKHIDTGAAWIGSRRRNFRVKLSLKLLDEMYGDTYQFYRYESCLVNYFKRLKYLGKLGTFQDEL